MGKTELDVIYHRKKLGIKGERLKRGLDSPRITGGAPKGKSKNKEQKKGERQMTSQRKCRICGCTEETACIDAEAGPCFWVDEDLCSHCLNIVDAQLFDDLLRERVHQNRKWGGRDHDDFVAAEDWPKIIMRLAAQALAASGEPVASFAVVDGGPARYRHHLLEIAATAISAAQSFDRLHPEVKS